MLSLGIYRDGPLNHDALAAVHEEALRERPALDERRQAIGAEIIRIERSTERCFDASEQGQLSPERCAQRIASLNARLEDLRAQQAEPTYRVIAPDHATEAGVVQRPKKWAILGIARTGRTRPSSRAGRWMSGRRVFPVASWAMIGRWQRPSARRRIAGSPSSTRRLAGSARHGDFLTGEKTPSDVRIELLTTVRAVLQVGPPRFPTSARRWRLMHKPASKKEVDLSGICEARDKHSNKLYRLFCVIDRDAPAHGLALPSLVLLGGVVKPARTEAPQSEYGRIDRYRKDYQATHRVALGRGAAEWWPDVGPDMS
ncbi:MAG TPA: hypothetical protein VNY52_01050 [Solirubrobacteraceae bacterium]|nr:hypothetical protein [Solirubrobacteraceae bacterium]